MRFIQLGNPQQNAYVERFNRTVRYDWLSHLFTVILVSYKIKQPVGYGLIIMNGLTWT
ncbi:transposase [Pseudoalteromonas sp. NZS127_1]|nr:transposase [Pseudoalteromonas sp. NZS127_1]